MRTRRTSRGGGGGSEGEGGEEEEEFAGVWPKGAAHAAAAAGFAIECEWPAGTTASQDGFRAACSMPAEAIRAASLMLLPLRPADDSACFQPVRERAQAVAQAHPPRPRLPHTRPPTEARALPSLRLTSLHKRRGPGSGSGASRCARGCPAGRLPLGDLPVQGPVGSDQVGGVEGGVVEPA